MSLLYQICVKKSFEFVAQKDAVNVPSQNIAAQLSPSLVPTGVGTPCPLGFRDAFFSDKHHGFNARIWLLN